MCIRDRPFSRREKGANLLSLRERVGVRTKLAPNLVLRRSLNCVFKDHGCSAVFRLNRYGCRDVRVRFVTFQCEVLEAEGEEVPDFGIQAHGR